MHFGEAVREFNAARSYGRYEPAPLGWRDSGYGVYFQDSFAIVHHTSGRFTAWYLGTKCLGRNLQRVADAVALCAAYPR